MADYELDEIHRIRREISERFNHDPEKLGAYYRALDQEFRKAGYKFADLPPEKPETGQQRSCRLTLNPWQYILSLTKIIISTKWRL